MSASRTFTPVKSTAIVASDPRFGYIGAERIRQATDIAMYLGAQLDLGGSETEGVLSASFESVPGAREYILDGDTLAGLTLEAVIKVVTVVGTTSVQARIRNTTDSSNAALGTSSVSTTPVSETLTLTLASGPKTYRLEVTGGNASAPVAAWGYIRIRRVPV